MTPTEFDEIKLAFKREEGRPGSPRFQVVREGSQFMARVIVEDAVVAIVGGVRMPNGDIHPWMVKADNEKSWLPVVPFERSRDLVRRLIVAAPAEMVKDVIRKMIGADDAEVRKLCPGCGEVFRGEVNTIAYNGIDRAAARCRCGWVGIAEQLVKVVGPVTVTIH